MSVENTKQLQTNKTNQKQTNMTTSTDITAEMIAIYSDPCEVARMIVALKEEQDRLRSDVDTLKASLSKGKKSSKGVSLDKKTSAMASLERKRCLKEEKDASKAVKDAEKLIKQEEKKEKALKVKEEKNAKALKVKEEKNAKALKVKEEKNAKALKVKAPSIDKTQFTIARFNRYRDLKSNDPNNDWIGLNGKRLRIAIRKDKSDDTVLKKNPENWTDEATAHLNALEDKWSKTGLPFSPDYVIPQASPPKKKPNKTKTLSEKVVVVDTTDEELEEEIPVGYSLYRRFRLNSNSYDTTWVAVRKNYLKLADKKGLVPYGDWAYMKTASGKQLNDKIYKENPKAQEEDECKDIIVDAKVVGNCASTFTRVSTRGSICGDRTKRAYSSDEEEEEDSKLPAPAVTFVDEYDEDGYKPFAHPDHFHETIKIHKDLRVFRVNRQDDDSVQDEFIGFYNKDTMQIGSDSGGESDASSEDPWELENADKDTVQFE